MTKDLKELLHKGGKCTNEDFNLLMQELPLEIDSEADSDGYKYLAYRDRYWFYIHEVRGYCVIHKPYELYKPMYFSPDLEKEFQYLERTNEQEAYILTFYDLSRQESFSSYEKLEGHFIASGGHKGADLKKDPEFMRIYNKTSIDSEDCKKLFEYRNYAVPRPESNAEVAVIWINEREHCTMDAWYYMAECCDLVCETTSITFYLDGAPVRCVPVSSNTNNTYDIDEEWIGESYTPLPDDSEDPFIM